jgi:carbamoyltransferase
VWRGRDARLERVNLDWRGPGFAAVYSRMTALLGWTAGHDEYLVESMARVGAARGDEVRGLLSYEGRRLGIAPGFDAFVAQAAGRRPEHAAPVACSVQDRLGELLAEFLRDVQRLTGASALCLGGGLFYNTYFNTVAAESGAFERVFVPVNPGNPGVAAGAALLQGLEETRGGHPGAASPFLGPSYSNHQIKSVLDNCKLQYEFVDDSVIVRHAVEALSRGELVGWFRGRLEWGTRALGNRSIFANPFAPYVLENLNRFLKHRDAHRAYGLAVCSEDRARWFEGPAASPFMEAEYRFIDRERFANVAPPGVARVRVQTVDDEPAPFRALLRAFGETGVPPVLVNTSFNGFHEPIVCSPRDAVRVFYGTGLDLLAIGNFLLRK